MAFMHVEHHPIDWDVAHHPLIWTVVAFAVAFLLAWAVMSGVPVVEDPFADFNPMP